MAKKQNATDKHHGKYEQARQRLSRRDSRLRVMIRRVGACTLSPDPDYFAILVRTIVSQQLSTKAAMSISNRLEQLLGREGITPKAIEAVTDVAIRNCGLSGAKLKSLRDLCAKVLNGDVDLSEIPALPDDEIKTQLTRIRGIGPWSADMFLIFSLGRMDVLPVGDLGLRAGVQQIYELEELPTAAQLEEIAAPWQPYRSVATWYFWRSRGPVPQS